MLADVLEKSLRSTDFLTAPVRDGADRRWERGRPVELWQMAAMRAHGVPEQILTDNGKVFTARFFHPQWRSCSTGSGARTASSTC